MGGDESATKRIDELQKDMYLVKPLMPLKSKSWIENGFQSKKSA